MRHLRNAAAASLAALALAGAVQAQESAGEMELPEACRTNAEASGMAGMDMGGMAGMDMGGTEQAGAALEGHSAAMMQTMSQTMGPMNQAIMIEDADLAFACGMIPHHQGAIGMAQAQLEFGEDEQMRALAEKIIEDQRREIEELTTWIEAQAQ